MAAGERDGVRACKDRQQAESSGEKGSPRPAPWEPLCHGPTTTRSTLALSMKGTGLLRVTVIAPPPPGTSADALPVVVPLLTVRLSVPPAHVESTFETETLTTLLPETFSKAVIPAVEHFGTAAFAAPTCGELNGNESAKPQLTAGAPIQTTTIVPLTQRL